MASASAEPVAAAGDPDVPYYLWPPFPVPPPTLFIVPFSKFEPAGIKVPASKKKRITELNEYDDDSDDDDYEEVDGHGIPTLMLGNAHVSLVPGEGNDMQLVKANAQKQKKQQRSAKKKLLAIDHPKKKALTWWQKWEQEELEWGAPRYNYNTNEDRADRLNFAVRAFRKGKALEPSIQSIWDKFLDYTGLQQHENAVPEKTKKKASYEDDDYDDEFDDDAGPLDGESPEDLLITFLDDPDKSIKIFFSSYYREKGFSYEESRLRDGPLVIGFFLKYLLRERVVPEYDWLFKRALISVETVIRPDLVALVPFQRGVEDDFSQACVYRLGTLVTYHGLNGISWMPTPEYNKMREREVAQTRAAIEKKKKEDEEAKARMKLEIMTQGMATVSLGDGGDWGSDNASVWGAPALTLDEASWGAPEPLDAAELDKWDLQRPTLAGWITDSYTLLRTEESARFITAILMPDPASPSRLKQKYATLVLEPWRFSAPPNNRDYLHPAVMLAVADGQMEKAVMKLRGGGHRLEDPIEVIMTADHAKKARVGLGINGVFVQAGKTKSVDAEVAKKERPKEVVSTADAGKSPVGGTKKKKGKAGPQAETFWFIQHARLVFPSFWTELPLKRKDLPFS